MSSNSNHATNLSSSSSQSDVPLAQKQPVEVEDTETVDPFLLDLLHENRKMIALLDTYVIKYVQTRGFNQLVSKMVEKLDPPPLSRTREAIIPDVHKLTKIIIAELERKDILFWKPLTCLDLSSGRLLIPIDAHKYFPSISGSVIQLTEGDEGRVRYFTIDIPHEGEMAFVNGWQSYVQYHRFKISKKPLIMVSQDHWEVYHIYHFSSFDPQPHIFSAQAPPSPPSPSPPPNSTPSRYLLTGPSLVGSKHGSVPLQGSNTASGSSSRAKRHKRCIETKCAVVPGWSPSSLTISKSESNGLHCGLNPSFIKSIHFQADSSYQLKDLEASFRNSFDTKKKSFPLLVCVDENNDVNDVDNANIEPPERNIIEVAGPPFSKQVGMANMEFQKTFLELGGTQIR